MVRTGLLGLMLGAVALLAAGCGGLPFDIAATAFAPTPVAAPGTPVTGDEAIPLTPEAQMAGLIRREGETHSYIFTGEAGQAVTVAMQAPQGGLLDSFLELVDPDGIVLLTNDDGGSGVDSEIFNYVLPASGMYTILAHGFSHTSVGAYSLQISLGTPIPTPTHTPTPLPGGGPVALGDVRTGTISGVGQADDWLITAEAGDMVTVVMRATGNSGLDPYLELLGPDGAILRVDDDSAGGLDARITDYRIPQTGTYTIRARALTESLGAYELTVREGRPPTPTPLPPTPGPSPTPFDRTITFGQRIEGQLRPNVGGDRYFLQVDEPTVVEVLLETADEQLRLYLELEQPVTGTAYLVDYGSASSVVYLPSVFLPMRGEYVFRVLAAASRFVDYTLVVNRVEIGGMAGGALAYGQAASGELTFPGQEDIWTFEGRAGDRVTIMMKGVNLDSYLQLLDVNGRRLASNDDVQGTGSLDARIEDTRLPEDGTYTIVASSFRSGSAGPYRLLLFNEASGE